MIKHISDGFFDRDGVRYYHGAFNPALIKEYIGTDPKAIMDIGAFDGGDSLAYRMQYPNADVYSFEACPERYNIVKQVEKYNIKVFHYAVCSKTGSVVFYQARVGNRSDAVGSLLKASKMAKEKRKDIKYGQTVVNVPSITLQVFCEQYGINEIDLLHIDVEGSVIDVLTGLGDMRPKIIYAEIGGVIELYCGASPIQKTNDILKSMGYVMYKDFGYDTIYLRNDVEEKYVGRQ